MECLYVPELSNDTESLSVKGEELKHLWALRLKVGEMVMLSNGKGICSLSQLCKISKTEAEVKTKEILFDFGENQVKIGLGLGILDSRDRMEFAIEKSVELGITDFYPIICEYSQKKTISSERLQSKAIAAMKQCKRSFLPIIHTPMTVMQVLNNSKDWKKIYIGDSSGEHIDNSNPKEPILVLIGTEGGFSKNEMKLFNQDSRSNCISLGSRRLRAETAAIVALSLVIHS